MRKVAPAYFFRKVHTMHNFFDAHRRVGFLTAIQVSDTYENTKPCHCQPGWYHWVESNGVDCLQGPFGTEDAAVADARVIDAL